MDWLLFWLFFIIGCAVTSNGILIGLIGSVVVGVAMLDLLLLQKCVLWTVSVCVREMGQVKTLLEWSQCRFGGKHGSSFSFLQSHQVETRCKLRCMHVRLL